jgi:flavin-dependent thymidylate synthase
MNNTVELIGYYGSDEIIACSAWTSTSRNLTEEKRNRIEGLINMLWTNGHETPFEKGVVHFLVNTDIATHIHLLKHRISSINAESARYKELKEDKYYIPFDWPIEWIDKLENYTKQGFKLYHECLNSLTKTYGIDRKRAKESARFFRGYNAQIEADVMFNMRSFANFLKLRNSEHAQKEIRDVAKKMEFLVQSIEDRPFKYTLKAFQLT